MSKKFTLVEFQIQDGDYEYFDYRSLFTSDFQKLSEMQIVALHFINDYKKKLLQDHDASFYWIDSTRTAYIYNSNAINLAEHDTLEKVGVLFSKPRLLFKKESNIIQLKRKVKNGSE